MKSVNLISMCILSIIFLACTNEADKFETNAIRQNTNFKTLVTNPGNKDNPYDIFGQSYRNGLLLYKASSNKPDNYEDLFLLVQELSEGSLPAIEVQTTQQLLAACMDTPYEVLGQILQNPLLSQTCITILSGFLYNYNNLANELFGKAYNDIIAIENSTIHSSSLSTEEQRIILVVTSITRYSLYHSCCEDTDWEKSVGNIIAALAGVLESNRMAVEYSLITSIAGLEEIQF
ncbi:hypothetical protein V1389_01520 [Flavobacterium rakeshii]|uniref:hypothetical protein n=1 Tax=Flavobacterium rakeshii TaxID=1038845 RepID=UPI002E7B1F33|nr:hypothetical protein [Flavobacterium rakeshii]MEE1896995.1 hypothetical protein [Flavobacterium rakeshii]